MIQTIKRRLVYLPFLIALPVFYFSNCSPSQPPAERGAMPSAVAVTVNPGGPVTIRTQTAEFEVLPLGYVQAYLLEGGKRLTLDEPGGEASTSAGFLVGDGK